MVTNGNISFEEMKDKIFCEDCLIGMKRIPDGTIDAVICDLPYGTTRNQWDSVIPLDKLWAEYRRITKPNAAIVLFTQQPFTSALVMSNPQMFRYEWVWQKENATGFLNANKMPMKVHENILVFYQKMPVYNPVMRTGFQSYKTTTGSQTSNYGSFKKLQTESNGKRYPTDVLMFARDSGGFHPTQKPVELLRYLIQTYTDEGMLVLDNCMGSGTTAVACIKENRHYVGFEVEKRYFDAAQERIRMEKAQLTLF